MDSMPCHITSLTHHPFVHLQTIIDVPLKNFNFDKIYMVSFSGWLAIWLRSKCVIHMSMGYFVHVEDFLAFISIDYQIANFDVEFFVKCWPKILKFNQIEIFLIDFHFRLWVSDIFLCFDFRQNFVLVVIGEVLEIFFALKVFDIDNRESLNFYR